MTGIPNVPDHAIQTLTVDRVSTDIEPFWTVSVECTCGALYPGAVVAHLTGALDVGVQVFLAHLAAVGES